MPLYSFEGRSPTIDPTAFVAPTAASIGDVHVEAGASVWFNAVIRADFAPIIVRGRQRAGLLCAARPAGHTRRRRTGRHGRTVV